MRVGSNARKRGECQAGQCLMRLGGNWNEIGNSWKEIGKKLERNWKEIGNKLERIGELAVSGGGWRGRQ